MQVGRSRFRTQRGRDAPIHALIRPLPPPTRGHRPRPPRACARRTRAARLWAGPAL